MKHYTALARSMIQGRNGSLHSEGAWQVRHEADEYIHHLPAGDVGGASGEEHQQLLLSVHLAAKDLQDTFCLQWMLYCQMARRSLPYALARSVMQGKRLLLLLNLPVQVCVGRSCVCSPWLTALFHTTPPHW
jgi:hypothetical protein